MEIKNIFVPYEESLDLFNLGFKEDCLACYRGHDLYTSYLAGYFEDWKLENNSNLDGERWIACPTFEQVFEWFREKHNFWSYIYPNIYNKDWNYHIQYYDEKQWGETHLQNGYKSFNEAKLEALKKLIKIIQNDN